MKAFLELITQHASAELPLDALVVVGSGRVADVSGIQKWCKRLILVDADPQIVQSNQLALKSQTRTEHHCLVMGVATGPTVFFKYNFPKFNGLVDQSRSSAAPPNLRLQEEVQVQALSLSDLFDRVKVSPDAEQVGLILDVGSSGIDGLEALGSQQAGALRLICLQLPHAQSLRSESDLTLLAQKSKMTVPAKAFSAIQQSVSWMFVREGTSGEGTYHEPAKAQAASAHEAAGDQKAAPLERKSNLWSDQEAVLDRQRDELDAALRTALGDLNSYGFNSSPASSKPEPTSSKPNPGSDSALQQQVHMLTQQLEQANQVRYEMQARLKHLLDKTEYNKLREELSQAKATVAELQAKVYSQEQLVEENLSLRAMLEEMQERQRLFNEEVIKGEAQIELIKDLMFRESGF